MNEVGQILFGFAMGFPLGFFFYGGLSFTTRKALGSRYPALWFFLSFLLRTILLLGGFYFISGGNWKILLATVAGFIISRYAFSAFGLIPYPRNRAD